MTAATSAAEHREIVIAGGGFAGAILARALHADGRDVLLLERGRHPRFALGESSTPLANLALERLAVRYGFEDLWTLAAHGRWRRGLPEVGGGLKRGFCFYSHRPGQAFVPDAAGSRRLVVAASPDDEVADNQWLRADVDRFLFERARAEGVDCREGTAVEVVSTPDGPRGGPVRIRAGGRVVEAGLLVDATGGSPLAEQLGACSLPPRLQTTLVYSHFDGIARFDRGDWPDSPFPERWSAAHHLLEAGWMYQLRFDDGSVSAGVLLPDDRPAAAAAIERLAGKGGAEGSEAAAVFVGLLERYPSLANQFAGRRPLRDLEARSGVAYRRDRAVGPGWLLLPHSYAFADPHVLDRHRLEPARRRADRRPLQRRFARGGRSRPLRPAAGRRGGPHRPAAGRRLPPDAGHGALHCRRDGLFRGRELRRTAPAAARPSERGLVLAGLPGRR